jgi:protein gp37
MANETNIPWCDLTWNIARGCTKVDEDCHFCYMYRESYNSTRYNPLQVVKTKSVFNLPDKYKETKSKVWRGNPLVFTSSLTDWGHPLIDPYRNEVFTIVRRNQHLIFQMLTKRTERLLEILPLDWNGYDNVWLGTSIGSQNSIERAWQLLKVPSQMYFLSLEPLWGEIDLNDAELLRKKWRTGLTIGRYVDWVIVGGESGNDAGKYRYRPCKLEWIEKIVYQCQAAGVPVFVKQLGTHLAKELHLRDRHGRDIREFPTHLQVRQFPSILNHRLKI